MNSKLKQQTPLKVLIQHHFHRWRRKKKI